VKPKHEIADLRHAGIEFPLLAFTIDRDVVSAVSRTPRPPPTPPARARFSSRPPRCSGATAQYGPENLEQELKLDDDHVDGQPTTRRADP